PSRYDRTSGCSAFRQSQSYEHPIRKKAPTKGANPSYGGCEPARQCLKTGNARRSNCGSGTGAYRRRAPSQTWRAHRTKTRSQTFLEELPPERAVWRLPNESQGRPPRRRFVISRRIHTTEPRTERWVLWRACHRREIRNPANLSSLAAADRSPNAVHTRRIHRDRYRRTYQSIRARP